MAATSTNKQPLLVDRVLHYVLNLDTAINSTIDIVGTNTAVPVINAVTSDGAIVEDIYSFSRGSAAETINLYLSDAADYLRPNEGILVGQFTSSASAGTVTRWTDMPFTLAPVPHVGNEARNRALYIPKGKALWAARESTAILTNGPLLGCQGGWY
jgi:hypothetical protein